MRIYRGIKKKRCGIFAIYFKINRHYFRDPGMRLLLEQMSTDRGAVREHLQNPEIFRKLMKLREAGIIKMA